MFGQKKKEEIKPEPVEPTAVIESETSEETPNEVAKQFVMEAPKPPESPVENAVPERYKYYVEKYHNAFLPQDFANSDKAEMHNLLFGILMEIKELKEAIQGGIKNE